MIIIENLNKYDNNNNIENKYKNNYGDKIFYLSFLKIHWLFILLMCDIISLFLLFTFIILLFDYT